MSRRFSEVQEELLYGPRGFYEQADSGPGRERDFVTSPEIGSVFAELLSVAVDQWWQQAGYPDPFVFVEAGAGTGTLARDLVKQPMRCRDALHYLAVERSARRRDQLAALSAITVRNTLPEAAHVIFANELLDNIPIDIVEYDGSTWRAVTFDDDGNAVGLGETAELAVPARPGSRVPVQRGQSDWVKQAASIARTFAVDYTSTTEKMAGDHSSGWLRWYRGHSRRSGGDITCDVAVDQLPRAASVRTQAEWLQSLGVDGLREKASRELAASIAGGGLDSVRARARLSEIGALVDPAGLGGFSVIEWSARG